MKITVNGAAHDVSATTLDAALAELGYDAASHVATAVNQTFVPASLRAGHALSPGDRIEILAPMQGG